MFRIPLVTCDPSRSSFVRTDETQAGVEVTKEYLQGKEGHNEVLYEYENAHRSHGISGVPYYVVSREGSKATVPLSGAQPPEAFVQAFEALS